MVFPLLNSAISSVPKSTSSEVFTYHSQRAPSGPTTHVSVLPAKQHTLSLTPVVSRPDEDFDEGGRGGGKK